MPGLFVFEGLPGTGKSAIIAGVKRKLREGGIRSATVALPGQGLSALDTSGSSASDGVSPECVQLYLPAEVDAIERLALPALAQHRPVLMEGGWWAPRARCALLGAAPGQLNAILALQKQAWRGHIPTAVFLVSRLRADASAILLDAYRALSRADQAACRVIELGNDGPLADAVDNAAAVVFRACALDWAARGAAQSPRRREPGRRIRREGDASGPKQASLVFSRLAPAEPSRVYDTYWRFASERQAIFFRRLRGAAGQLTADPILSDYKFTNAYRASDRVSQFLIGRVIHAHNQQPDEVFFRTILFKLFNRIDTWLLLEQELGTLRLTEFDVPRYDDVLSRALAAGRRIYSAAYIMPPARAFGLGERKHLTHLRLLARMIADDLPQRVAEARSMRRTFELLRSYPMLGDFLAYQFTIDLNYGPLNDFSEMEFVVPGPGARDGLHKCFLSSGGLNEADLIRLVADRQELEFERLGIAFQSLWGRRLQLVDCQNLFCEVDKYARLAHPEILGLSGRTRIKQTYRPNPSRIHYWYPPKWDINEAARADEARAILEDR